MVFFSGSISDCADLLFQDVMERLRHGAGPVFVVLGEIHGTMSHELTPIVLLDRLVKSGVRVAIGLESPINYAPWSLARCEQSPARMSALSRKEQDIVRFGAAHLSGSLSEQLNAAAFLYNQAGDWARKMLISHATGLHVPVRFNDCPIIDQGGEICIETGRKIVDGTTYRHIYPRLSMLAVPLRNRHMAQQITAQTEAFKADVFIQSCGSMHVAGIGSTHADSLAGLLLQQYGAASVMPVVMVAPPFTRTDFHRAAQAENNQRVATRIMSPAPAGFRTDTYDFRPLYPARTIRHLIERRLDEAGLPKLSLDLHAAVAGCRELLFETISQQMERSHGKFMPLAAPHP